jgi:hypothetical protein
VTAFKENFIYPTITESEVEEKSYPFAVANSLIMQNLGTRR